MYISILYKLGLLDFSSSPTTREEDGDFEETKRVILVLRLEPKEAAATAGRERLQDGILAFFCSFSGEFHQVG